MKAKELLNIGFEQGPLIGLLLKSCQAAKDNGCSSDVVRNIVIALHDDPTCLFDDIHFGIAAKELHDLRNPQNLYEFTPKEFKVWGDDLIDQNTRDQMANCMQLPVVVGGAMMGDAHFGYGVPIGGVLATKGAVIPFAVGVDIGCRMQLSVLPITNALDPISRFEDEIVKSINKNTRFGVGAEFEKHREHAVMDMDWGVTNITKQLKDLAARQLGSSGGGNHFTDVCEITFKSEFNGVQPGVYVAILTHSGSRGPGSKVASYYSKLAQSIHSKLPPQYKFLAWLDMDKEGAEYWAAMELMGHFASANHHCIHDAIAKDLNVTPILTVENHHNFCWKEIHNGEEVFVHRKGATPAGKGVLGIIPGSMATPAYLVQGKGNESSFCSASHGAGRTMSRTKAKESFRWGTVNQMLKENNVKLLSGGLDEVPGSYKDVRLVMAAQSDLVDIVAELKPRIVKMSDDGTQED